MEQNKTGKYFKYAIGEIVLVVIGILIAISINNWNTNRINNKFVSLILKEIYYDLSDDYEIIYSGVEPRLKLMQLGVKKIKEFMIKGEAPSDSTFLVSYRNMKRGFLLSQSTGAFESLKLGGLDKIKNDSLRTRLLEFYESDIPRSIIFISNREDFIQERIEILEADLFNFRFITINDSIKRHVIYPKNKEYINHQSLHKIYDLLSKDIRQKNYRLRGLKQGYDDVMHMIEKELEIRGIQFEYLDISALKRDF